MSSDLPGDPGVKLQRAYSNLPEEAKEPMHKHLLGDTSADFLSNWFRRWGTPISATTIRVYRRSLDEGVCK